MKKISTEWLNDKSAASDFIKDLNENGGLISSMVIECFFKRPIPPSAEEWETVEKIVDCETEAQRLTDEAWEQYGKMFDYLKQINFKYDLAALVESEDKI